MSNCRDAFVQMVYAKCKHKKLQEYLQNFYDDCVNFYKDVTFTKENFDEIQAYDGQYEQDVVRDLFRTKSSVNIEEVLVYLFGHYVNKIQFVNHHQNEYLGMFCIPEKTIRIFNTDVLKSSKNKRDKKLLALLKNFNISTDDAMKRIVYHEMNHVLELKMFLQGKIMRDNLNDAYLLEGDTFSTFATREMLSSMHVKNFLKTSKKQDEVFHFYNAITELQGLGYADIAEARNEIIANKILGTYDIYPTLFTDERVYVPKYILPSVMRYTENYDIYACLRLLEDTDERLTRFCISKFVDEVNAYACLPEIKQEVLQAFSQVLASLSKQENPLYKTKQWKYIITHQTPMEALSLMQGCAIFCLENGNINGFLKIKTCEQKLLIEMLRMKFDKLTQYVSAEDALKWAEKVLCNVDDVLLVPNEKIKVKKDKLTDVYTVDIYTFEQYLQLKRDMPNLVAFKNFIEDIKRFAKKKGYTQLEEWDYFADQAEMEYFYNEQVKPYIVSQPQVDKNTQLNREETNRKR